jgi:opacity protein-like surface antigen
VGVGIGAANNWVDDVSMTKGGVTAILDPGGRTWQFAWAVMAGVGVPISPTLTLDLGVRYSDFGDLRLDPGSLKNIGGTVGVYGGANGKLRAWELTVGLRF